MITPHIFALSTFLSVTWGIYLVYAILDYRRTVSRPTRRRGEVITAFRRMIVVFCLWTICFAYVFRTAMVLAGLGETVAGQITFFAMLGPNVVGSLFSAISLRYD